MGMEKAVTGKLAGGCLCGAVRYAVTAAPLDSGYCHCRICQRNTGAPAVAYAEIPVEGFAFTAGAPKVYRSSANGLRHFCGDCGTPLTFRARRAPRTVAVNLASLDDPSAAPPRRHIWTGSRIPWFEIADDLPRHPDEPPLE